MKTTARKLTFKRASLISAIIAGTPFLVLLIYLLCELLMPFIEGLGCDLNILDIVFEIFSVYSPLAWMISCIVFSWGIIRDGEHFPSIPKRTRWFLQIWTIFFVINSLFFLLAVFGLSAKLLGEFTNYPEAQANYDCFCGILGSVVFAGLVLCFHYMIWFWYLYKRPLPNTTVSRNAPWMKCIAWVTILGVIGTTILAVLVAAYGIMYTKQHMSGEFMLASLIMYFSYIIIAPLFLSLCLFLQPIFNRRANKRLAATHPEQATDDTTTDSSDPEQATDNTITAGNTEQITDAQPTIEE